MIPSQKSAISQKSGTSYYYSTKYHLLCFFFCFFFLLSNDVHKYTKIDIYNKNKDSNSIAKPDDTKTKP